jgi:mono/diheme cytochrome c family protein
MRGRSVFAASVALACVCAAARADSAVDFARDIKPILDTSCVSCHGPEKQKGGLRLDVKAAALKGGTSGVTIVPGKGKDSPLVHRVLGLGEDDRMPLKKDPLSERQVRLITAWIDQGAQWPEAAGAPVVEAKHWSFVKPVRPELPKLKDAAWVRNPIDAFVLARLEKEGIKPSPEASKETLIRRVSLDLTGLPPTVEEIDAFLKDESPGAYERVVDRLLASPHYGERWGRHWLDGARYADSSGYSIDAPRSMWAYRDWVIAAMNADMPFDQFTIEQIAGDLLPKATAADRIATGFHRNTQINQEGGIDPEQFRVEANIDRVSTTGTVWLGLTIGCAQCHNHKFDPIAQKEYYRLFAFFNNDVFDPKKPDEPKLRVEGSGVRGQGSGKKTGAKAPSAKKGEVDTSTTLVMAELAEPRETHLFIKGDFTRPAEVVTPGVPAVLHPMKARGARADRLDLAWWLVDSDNPLTARVTMNRMWMQYFGKGIVETENDFGTQGDKPTNPELLDWLATEFMGQHWSMKAIHRLIVTSTTYRQSSNVRPELANTDPLNKLLARQTRVRLDAEIVREVELAASGLLCPKVGGPSVYPPLHFFFI